MTAQLFNLRVERSIGSRTIRFLSFASLLFVVGTLFSAIPALGAPADFISVGLQNTFTSADINKLPPISATLSALKFQEANTNALTVIVNLTNRSSGVVKIVNPLDTIDFTINRTGTAFKIQVSSARLLTNPPLPNRPFSVASILVNGSDAQSLKTDMHWLISGHTAIAITLQIDQGQGLRETEKNTAVIPGDYVVRCRVSIIPNRGEYESAVLEGQPLKITVRPDE